MNDRNLTRTAAALALALTISGHVRAQETPAPATGTPAPASTANPAAIEEEDEGEMIVLSPFEVTASTEGTYTEGATLAGNRLATDLRDLGNAVSVVNAQFLKDTGATDNQTLLQYTVGTEVGNVYGNYAGVGNNAFLDESSKFTQPNQNTRVRGLAAADNARDFFLTDVPWDGAIIDRVELQRGPQSTLYGMGSPAGVINSGTKQASYRNAASAEVRVGSFGTVRGVLDVNRELIDDQLAVRGVIMSENEKFKQAPAFEDDLRYYGALRFEPGFLKKGSARTIIKANIEVGDIESNRPRSLPPMDLVTPWFRTGTYTGTYKANGSYRDPATGDVVNVNAGDTRVFQNLNRATYIPSQLQDDNTGLPNHGQMRTNINGGDDNGFYNPYYQPLLGNFAQQFGGPMVFFDGDSPAVPSRYYTWEPTARRGIGSDGMIDNGVGSIPYQRPGGINRNSSYAFGAGLPYSQFGVYKDWTLTDSSVFDFYNNLMDGPNKGEWQDFNVYNLNFTQTFFNDKIGIEGVYTAETYRNGQLSLMAGERQAIYIDVNSVYSDGSPSGLNGEPHADGTPNPNVGRAYLSDSGQFGNNSYLSDRDTLRFTAFATHDFAKENKSFLPRLLGKHTVTGMLANENQSTDRRYWQRYGANYDWDRWNTNPDSAPLKFTDNYLTPQTVIYLGDSLLNSPTASGARLPRPKAEHVVTSGQIRAFDSNWNWSNGVDPSAPWFNNYYPVGDTRGDSTQSENMANYVGYRDVPLAIYDTEAPGNTRDYQTREARLTHTELESKVFVWQGHLWDNALVGTWSWRNDYQEGWQLGRNTDSNPEDMDGDGTAETTVRYADGRLILSPDVYRLYGAPSVIDEDSTSWMAVAHLNQFPGLNKLMERLPVNVSLFYNESSNFQPAALRVDVYGESLASPSGETTDMGVLLQTKDGKYSFKVNKYETKVTNASSGAIGGAWFIGSSQAWAGNWVNRFEFNWTSDHIGGAVANPDPENSLYNYGSASGETLAQAQAREQAAITAWRNWQDSVDPRFYEAWSMNLDDQTRGISASTPQGFTVTEDATSEGWEFEASAQPIKNWRIMINGAKTAAQRKNVGGTNLRAFVSSYEDALRNSALGDLRIWWGGAGNETTLQQWNNNIGTEWAARALQEGTDVPELREWRWNVINTYDFSTGWLKNVSVGGAVRYQSDVIIGYPPIPGATANEVSFDLANPYKGPAETDFDVWIGYWRKLGDKVTWNIQLNVRNAFNGNELIPISTQPDGSAAGYRIKPPQTWTLTNTFKF